MCGRAGRGGTASRAHLFFNSRRKKINPMVKEYCSLKENCRRRFMLTALGSTERVTQTEPCCDVCSSSSVPVELHFEAHATTTSVRRNSRRTAVRKVSKDDVARLKENLKLERQAFIQEHSSFSILGTNFVCPDSAIEKICDDVKFISSIGDLNNITILPEMKSRLLEVVLNMS